MPAACLIRRRTKAQRPLSSSIVNLPPDRIAKSIRRRARQLGTMRARSPLGAVAATPHVKDRTPIIFSPFFLCLPFVNAHISEVLFARFTLLSTDTQCSSPVLTLAFPPFVMATPLVNFLVLLLLSAAYLKYLVEEDKFSLTQREGLFQCISLPFIQSSGRALCRYPSWYSTPRRSSPPPLIFLKNVGTASVFLIENYQ